MSDTCSHNADLDRFLYLVSHDLKADVRGLNDIPQWIIEDCADAGTDLPQEVREHLALLQSVSDRLGRRIDRLADYRCAGRLSKTPRVESVAEEALRAWKAMDLPSDWRLQFPGSDADYLAKVEDTEPLWKELLHNAVSHAQKGAGCVRVLSETSSTMVRVTIEDDGPGIDLAFRDRAFDAFCTLSRKEESSGVGLGLTIAQRISQAASGRISIVEPRTGRGCAVLVELPKP